ncbi:YqzE family protein [Bacillus niameyensis]|uniref:YqzE family protein n=1 Tax=Bacillus niameyensis TaxID=1522308 RepID=UPI001E5C0250|nr:YqzE family protein [Bacillus niameyensis]
MSQLSFNDYVKFMTESFVKHFELPKSERIQLKQERKEAKPPMIYQWFGLLPFSIRMLFKKNG